MSHPESKQPRRHRAFRSLTTCLCGMLVALLCCLAGTAQAVVVANLPFSKLAETFPPVSNEVQTADMVLSTFAAGDLHCLATVDARGMVHQIFLLPGGKEIPAGHFREEAARLHRYVATFARNPADVRLIHFERTTAAVINCIPEERRTSFSRPVLGDGTMRVLDTAFNCGAKPDHLENGELTLVIPSKENPSEHWGLALSLHRGTVDVLGFFPPPSKGKKESSAIASLVDNLRIVRTSIDAKESPELLQSAAKQTGAAKCLTRAGETAVVVHQKKLYVGSLTNLRHYIRGAKKEGGGFLGPFRFPSTSRPIPGAPAADSSGEDDEDEDDEDDDEDEDDEEDDTTPAKPSPSQPKDSTPAKPVADASSTPAAPAAASTDPAHAKALQSYLDYLKRLQK